MISGVNKLLMKVFSLLDAEKMANLMQEERHIREENMRLQRKLQMEIDRREALCRHLSESESSLEMDDERCVERICESGVYIDYVLRSQQQL
jgi:coiled-coil domain-containing protein 6